MTAKIVDVAIVVTLPKLHSTHSGVFRPLSSMTCMTELSERYGISSPSFLSEVIHYPHNAVRLQTSIQSKVIGILWKVGGNRRRRGKGSCSPAASGTSGWLLFELELLDCHNTYELTLIRIRLGKT